jgi:protein-S-isoprenylcysteine O-methyltransferase Ste14
MTAQFRKPSTLKEILFYALGGLLIAGFIILYFPRFLGIGIVPPAIRYLFYQLGPNWAIAVNAGLFILFLLFLPYRTKIEWRSKSVFAAFILALMAEMFGIPLLLYILSPVMRISYYAKRDGGWLNNPLIFGWNGAVIGVWLTLIGMIIVIIGWHQIHRAKGLVTTGIYKFIRHPQYTGFFLVMTGWLLHWETTLTLAMYPILVLMYYLLARKEDADLKNEFGDEYEVYRRKTPMFLPIRWKVLKT